MNDNKNFSREDVWRFLDDEMSQQEKDAFQAALKSNLPLAEMFEQEKIVKSYFTQIPITEPGAHFTARVMEKIQKPQGEYSISIKRSMLLLAGVLLVTLITSFLVAQGTFDTPGTISLPEVSPLVNQYIPAMPQASQFTFNNKMLVNGIIILNLIIGFILLDRAVLRPFFQKRFRHT